MPLILQRGKVLEVYAEATNREWVLPAFNAENLTTIEAILQAVLDHGKRIGVDDLPIIIGITNNYKPRPQSSYYTQSRQWDIGLKLFLSELQVLTSAESPFAKLKVMIHLDHIQWDEDQDLLNWDMNQFSSIMYDASTIPFSQNIKKTAAFREQHDDVILIEGACDEIKESGSVALNNLTSPEMAERYFHETGVDLVVANLGTEHRAPAVNLKYHSELARKITSRIGSCLCLHGTSSVSTNMLPQLFEDGIRKVNIWTALERESSATLFHQMLENTTKIIGHKNAQTLVANKVLGDNVDSKSEMSSDFYTTTYRQRIIYKSMKEIISRYLDIFYTSN